MWNTTSSVVPPPFFLIATEPKRLESAELLTRLRDVEDERRVLIRLSAAGRKLKTRAARIPACVLDASQCNLAEAMALTQQVQALRDRLMA